MNTPTAAGDIALFSGFMLAMIALGLIGLGWPAWGLWRWRGGWRFAAAVPAVVMPFVVLRIVMDTALDSTSHNLGRSSPDGGGLSAAIMIALPVARSVSRNWGSSRMGLGSLRPRQSRLTNGWGSAGGDGVVVLVAVQRNARYRDRGQSS